MEPKLLVFVVTIGAVALFVVGMSLTLIFKGHHIDSEIGDNKHMKKKGIKCAAQQIRAEEAALYGDDALLAECENGGCASCSVGGCGGSEDVISSDTPDKTPL